ncbi:AAA family ATPase [Paraburkholderia sp. BCC1886]|uniref:AAA family ATPase n=1 Tax=Paraburkholderia sp. BCC1886 TaxID=2562670 RepID=UPI001183CD23|nr:AAA family ATPase [Paraburkholderia sp. BCC1886]
MKSAALRNVNAIDQDTNAAADFPVIRFSTVRPLNSHFDSIGDALFSWTNSTGYLDPDNKALNGTAVRAFCQALGLPVDSVDTNRMLTSEHYFESDAWFFEYVDAKALVRLGRGDFVMLDEGNRPVLWISYAPHPRSNFCIEFSGSETLVHELRELTLENVKTDAKQEEKETFVEVVFRESPFGGGLTINEGKIENARTSHPEFYPYLDGGLKALIEDFLNSEESVLILKGPPGTGKTSMVSAAVSELGLLPIYAKRADAILHKDFVTFIFNSSDGYMANVAGTEAKERKDLFSKCLGEDREFKSIRRIKADVEEKDTPRIPIIVVEDADQLLTPRSAGNVIMPQLLNETDGIGSNHTRKIIFTTNLSSTNDIDEALMRPGRCYDVVECRLLTPEEAVVARRASGLPDFEVVPTGNVSLAETLRKPRKKISIANGRASLGFTTK